MQGDTRAETGLAYYQYSVFFFVTFDSDNNKFSGLMLTLLRTSFALGHYIEDIFYCLLEGEKNKPFTSLTEPASSHS